MASKRSPSTFVWQRESTPTAPSSLPSLPHGMFAGGPAQASATARGRIREARGLLPRSRARRANRVVSVPGSTAGALAAQTFRRVASKSSMFQVRD